MFDLIFAAVIPVLVMTGLGFVWVRRGQSWDNALLTPLVVNIGTPALVFATFAKTSLPPIRFAGIAGAYIVALFCFALTAAVLLRLTGWRVRTFLPTLTFPNVIVLGLPLSLFAFGTEGMSYAIVISACNALAQFTIGQAIAAGGSDWRGLFKMPLIYAVAAGIVVSMLHVTLPEWFSRTANLIGSLAIPLMLFMLGASLARLPAGSSARATALAAWRIGVGGAIGFAVAMAFGLDGIARRVLILQCAMPSAVYNYLFAQRWNNEPEEVASVIVVATIAAVVTVPLLLKLLITS